MGTHDVSGNGAARGRAREKGDFEMTRVAARVKPWRDAAVDEPDMANLLCRLTGFHAALNASRQPMPLDFAKAGSLA
jgi:hypothetical protein